MLLQTTVQTLAQTLKDPDEQLLCRIVGPAFFKKLKAAFEEVRNTLYKGRRSTKKVPLNNVCVTYESFTPELRVRTQDSKDIVICTYHTEKNPFESNWAPIPWAQATMLALNPEALAKIELKCVHRVKEQKKEATPK